MHRVDGGVVGAHDLSAHGKVYGLAALRSEEQGMHGFYALCWRRGPDGRSGAVRLVARWFAGGANGAGATAHWDLPGVTTPHMLDVVGGAVGGTAAWGRGISLLVAETRPDVGDANLRRAWLGDKRDGDDETRFVVAPARGWTPDSEPAVDVPALRTDRRGDERGDGSRRDTTTAEATVSSTIVAERASGAETVGDADSDAQSYDADADDGDEDEVRLPAPQHGGGGGGILPGGGLVVERGSMDGVGTGRSPLAAATAAAAAMAVACAIARGRGGGARRGFARLRLDVDPKRAGAAGREAGFRAARQATREIEMQP